MTKGPVEGSQGAKYKQGPSAAKLSNLDLAVSWVLSCARLDHQHDAACIHVYTCQRVQTHICVPVEEHQTCDNKRSQVESVQARLDKWPKMAHNQDTDVLNEKCHQQE